MMMVFNITAYFIQEGIEMVSVISYFRSMVRLENEAVLLDYLKFN